MPDMSDFNFLRRISLVAVAVVSLHAGLILALQSSLNAPVRERVVPVSLLSQPAAATEPAVPTAPLLKGVQQAPAPIKPESSKNPESPQSATAPAPLSPASLTTANANTAASSPTPAPAASPAASSKTATMSATAGTGAATVHAPHIEWPSSDADYLRNPKPIYPELSKRLNEQGTVIYGVLIGADGRPVSARLVQSSGFDRLDKAAYEAVMQWRYVPGKRQGVPEAMTFNVPVKWALE